MSRITQKGATGELGLFNQGFSANPANSAAIPTGTGAFTPDLQTMVGTKWDTADGREFVLVQNGAVALVSGVLAQASTQVANFERLAMTVPAAYPATAGSTQILVTNGATKLNVNQFQGGYLITATGTGIGQMLRIASHQNAAASATFVVTLEDAVVTTLDATTTVSLMANPYSGVLISNHSTLGLPIGVTLSPIAASTAPTYDGTSGALTTAGVAQYGFVCTHGAAACLIDALTNVGYPVGPSTNTDGALNVATLTSSPQVGISGQTQVSTDVGLVYLNI